MSLSKKQNVIFKDEVNLARPKWLSDDLAEGYSWHVSYTKDYRITMLIPKKRREK